ncbi:farnesyl-diphosphate synthase [Xaviernesmea oryzae]|uniref:Probable farnesyl diphosphate synthase n=1 Tax=Xaviernesmea oryzae TaxID=464029 RepID=A0A1Q9AXV7_9HYPH|nr:farnesyl diphosphate synthase [Xaviernesmea oryzae]OLP60288.1 farnesyl-diphosphate synthase [Xaviernesmea oryzae]SEK24756.1 farnesyl diphosphate synthase [Xaviernesmea oryzae]
MTESDRLFLDDLASAAQAVETCLEGLLSPVCRVDEIARPDRLLNAMRHGVLNGGKRMRPYLVLESARLCGGDPQAALRIAAALECIHCYSLVHDDLPAMDDDDLRRGKPTVHIAYDEATAILAGDSLLTLAFDIAAAPETPLSGDARASLVCALARAAGIGGMAGGQALDLAAEITPPDEAGIVTLQAMKTGALIRFACEAGALIAGSDQSTRASLRRYGEVIGRAFQIADDLLDITSDAASLGKATGKDEGRGKGTLVGLRGVNWARDELARLVAEAESLLSAFGDRGEKLKAAARFVANRKS